MRWRRGRGRRSTLMESRYLAKLARRREDRRFCRLQRFRWSMIAPGATGMWSSAQCVSVHHEAGLIDDGAGNFLCVLYLGGDLDAIDHFALGDDEVFGHRGSRAAREGDGEDHGSRAVWIDRVRSIQTDAHDRPR